ncbi:putative transmembrane protein [Toxoplasma gondii TgCatPRC2]|uniref:Transmembrane protein n=4 Tax=Toxoplasma gondii TaxID=5811 RepID=S8FZS1_TOXGM|nr:hypothetical protein TGME49_217420 [Toxoplasma gondii ME49]ESS34120.1 putative transmembrane protein [Toxoplasma gondii VEG]KYF48897.1 hypothetical protein TGARI_217420 [Toxoplasma gondii ARI]KYK67027.1 putative transmembrane protein [Toxoplasma gondii TgCatPRC2]EPT24720.1 hypothetical protein TGME49_217420 [Toxoplasma gondii ME49]CEL78204.1 TPA: hypothetical protein BN1205_007110 [Toxoplasma gondii VEG]|eukprot:XP_018634850.1 hypothetical protein TGME49_217420 [Toxoplasma gondii ME49]
MSWVRSVRSTTSCPFLALFVVLSLLGLDVRSNGRSTDVLALTIENAPSAPTALRDVAAPQPATSQASQHSAQKNIKDDPESVLNNGKSFYDFFHQGQADEALKCVRLLDAKKRREAARRFCRGFGRNQILRSSCEHQSDTLLQDVDAAAEGLGSQPFPELFEKMNGSLEHPYFPARTPEPDLQAVTEFIRSTTKDTWTEPYHELLSLPTNSCSFAQGARLLMAESTRMKAKAKSPVETEAVQLVAARRTLYSTVWVPVASSLTLGIWSEIVDFSRCRRLSGVAPPSKMSAKEIVYRVFGFALARTYIPRSVQCQRQSTEPLCRMLIGYLAVSRAIIELGRVLGTPQEQKLMNAFAETTVKIRDSLTDEEISATQMQVEATIVEVTLIALSGTQKLVKLVLAMAKSKTMAKFISLLVSKLKKWLYSFEKESIESAASHREILPMLLALENANSTWLGGTGRCVRANKGLENLMVSLARRLAKDLKPKRASSFLEVHEAQLSTGKELAAVHTTRLVSPHEDTLQNFPKTLGVLSLVQVSQTPRFVGVSGWMKRRPSHYVLAFIGFAMTMTVVGAACVPLISPLFVVFLVMGVAGFVIFATFTTLLVQRNLLIRATQQAVEEIQTAEQSVQRHLQEMAETGPRGPPDPTGRNGGAEGPPAQNIPTGPLSASLARRDLPPTPSPGTQHPQMDPTSRPSTPTQTHPTLSQSSSPTPPSSQGTDNAAYENEGEYGDEHEYDNVADDEEEYGGVLGLRT